MEKELNRVIKIYTDGSALNNNIEEYRRSGIGVVILVLEANIIIAKEEIGKYIGNQTNNAAELLAVLEGLNALNKFYSGQVVIIYTDSNYVIKTFTEWIKWYMKHNWVTKRNKRVKNIALIKDIYVKLLELQEVYFVKVKGHSGDKWNIRADALARRAALLQKMELNAGLNGRIEL